MEINANDQIAGLPALRIRQAFKAAGSNRMVWPLCAEHLCVTEARAKEICDRLVQDRYLVVEQEVNGATFYRQTNTARALKKASVPDSISSDEALRLLGLVLDCIRKKNMREPRAINVTAVQIIGELLSIWMKFPHLELNIQFMLTQPDSEVSDIQQDDVDRNIEALRNEVSSISPSICLRFARVSR